MQGITLHPRTKLDYRALPNFLEQTFEHLPSEVGVGHLASTEEDRGLYLVALVQEAQHVILLELVIMFIDVDAELHFLDGDDLLVLLGRALLLLFLVEKLAIVLNAANRRVGGSGNLYQVKATFTGDFERFKRLHDAELGTVLVDNADFAGANALISADKTLVDTFLRGVATLEILEFKAKYSMGYKLDLAIWQLRQVRNSSARLSDHQITKSPHKPCSVTASIRTLIH